MAFRCDINVSSSCAAHSSSLRRRSDFHRSATCQQSQILLSTTSHSPPRAEFCVRSTVKRAEFMHVPYWRRQRVWVCILTQRNLISGVEKKGERRGSETSAGQRGESLSWPLSKKAKQASEYASSAAIL